MAWRLSPHDRTIARSTAQDREEIEIEIGRHLGTRPVFSLAKTGVLGGFHTVSAWPILHPPNTGSCGSGGRTGSGGSARTASWSEASDQTSKTNLGWLGAEARLGSDRGTVAVGSRGSLVESRLSGARSHCGPSGLPISTVLLYAPPPFAARSAAKRQKAHPGLGERPILASLHRRLARL